MLGAAAGGVASVLISTSGGSVRPWLVVAIATTVAVLAFAIWTLSLVLPAQVPEFRRPKRVRTDRERGGTEQAARLLDKAMRDPGRFADVVRPQLIELAAHKLWRRHRVDFRHDPDRARDLVGESLWQLMTSKPSAPTYDQLAEWLTRIESL